MNLLRVLSGRLRPFALALVLLGVAASAGASPAVRANASPAEATDAAFGILLAMPDAQHSRGWMFPQAPAKDEAALIARWQRLKQQGADFNAFRHRGTLLAHAVRAGKDRAAVWLLHNGADPHKVVFEGADDAWTLALKFDRPAVRSVLEAQYGFTAKPPRVKPAPPVTGVSAATAALPAWEQQAIALMHRLGGQELHPGPEAQATWRRYAATLTDDQFRILFGDDARLQQLVILIRDSDGGLEEALARLPLERVRAQAQPIADRLAEWSFVTYGAEQKIEATGAARSWPALWRRLDKPLSYDKIPELAGRIPPGLWAGLFASGYAVHDPAVTGCALAAIDLPTLKAVWPAFQRDFTDARAEAPGLVLDGYRIARSRYPCAYGSTQAETAAKLAFLRADGVTGPVYGLRETSPDAPLEPALASLVGFFSPKAAVEPRLVVVAPACTLALDDRWWDALSQARSIGWGIPPTQVQVLDVPGATKCGLLVTGDRFGEWTRYSDSFDQGPFRDPPAPRCADAPDDGEIWVSERDGIRHVEVGAEGGTRGALTPLLPVRDRQTGRRYLLNTGHRAAQCSAYELPDVFAWQVDAQRPRLMPSGDDFLVVRLLSQQCEQLDERGGVTCPSLDAALPDSMPILERLRRGASVEMRPLLDAWGVSRLAAYRAAVASHDHARLHELLRHGIPPWWTADEIKALAQADLPLEEKRRRVALLFADAGQLAEALQGDEDQVPESLATWLPREDWAPILRIVARKPDAWFDMALHLRPLVGKELACQLDRAQQFVCGGGVTFE